LLVRTKTWARLATSTLPKTSLLRVQAQPPQLSTLQQDGTIWVFHVVTGNTFSISGVTISGGNIPGGNGGGIFNEGTLTVANCTFQNNQANTGGAIFNNGTQMTVTGSTFNLNTAGGGGAIFT
jgi:hypothetical protein